MITTKTTAARNGTRSEPQGKRSTETRLELHDREIRASESSKQTEARLELHSREIRASER